MQNNIEEIKKTSIEYLSSKPIEDVLEYLLKNLNGNHINYDETVLLSGRFYRSKKLREEKLITADQFEVDLNRIGKSLQKVVDDLEKNDKIKKQKKTWKKKLEKRDLLILICFLQIINLIGIVYVLTKLN